MKEEKKVDLFKHAKPKQLAPSQLCENIVRTIIDNNCKDPNQIEWNFDALIPHLSNVVISGLYVELLEYYKVIDAEGAAYYWEIYDNDYRTDPNSISLDAFNEDFFYD